MPRFPVTARGRAMIFYLAFIWIMVAAFALAMLMTLYDNPKSDDDRLVYMVLLAAIWPLIAFAFVVSALAWLAGAIARSIAR
jgi:hypothetical protein